MKEAMSEFNRLMAALQTLTQDEDEDIAIPVLASFLAACGAFSMRDRALFKSFVCDAIDRAYDDLQTRKTQ